MTGTEALELLLGPLGVIIGAVVLALCGVVIVLYRDNKELNNFRAKDDREHLEILKDALSAIGNLPSQVREMIEPQIKRVEDKVDDLRLRVTDKNTDK